jgi:hypothetical protein
MRLYINEYQAKTAKVCDSPDCVRTIEEGQRYVELKEFDYVTKRPGKIRRRHTDDPAFLSESRERDAVKKGSKKG